MGIFLTRVGEFIKKIFHSAKKIFRTKILLVLIIVLTTNGLITRRKLWSFLPSVIKIRVIQNKSLEVDSQGSAPGLVGWVKVDLNLRNYL